LTTTDPTGPESAVTPRGLARFGPLGAVALFWLFHRVMGGLTVDHLAAGGVVLGLYGAGPRLAPWRRLIVPALVMAAFYEGQKYVAAGWRGPVHIAGPHQVDLQVFGVPTPAGPVLPTVWVQQFVHPILDLILGPAYIAFAPAFVATCAWFYFVTAARPGGRGSGPRVRLRAEALMWAMVGLTVAPPWYVERYGLGPVRLDALPSPAGAARFDALVGLDLMARYYSRTPNVFGAIPSLHAAFPALAAYGAFRLGALRAACTAYALIVAFAAVYLNHHWVLDIVWGWAYALVAGVAWDRYCLRVQSTAAPTDR